jgi:hypothetical protein
VFIIFCAESSKVHINCNIHHTDQKLQPEIKIIMGITDEYTSAAIVLCFIIHLQESQWLKIPALGQFSPHKNLHKIVFNTFFKVIL